MKSRRQSVRVRAMTRSTCQVVGQRRAYLGPHKGNRLLILLTRGRRKSMKGIKEKTTRERTERRGEVRREKRLTKGVTR